MSIIFFDIDGTIMDTNGEIPTSAISAIHQLRNQGHYCVVNTGRPYVDLDPSLFDIGFDGLICTCGQHIKKLLGLIFILSDDFSMFKAKDNRDSDLLMCFTYHTHNVYLKDREITDFENNGPGVKFCVSDFRQSQEWRWKAGRILA